MLNFSWLFYLCCWILHAYIFGIKPSCIIALIHLIVIYCLIKCLPEYKVCIITAFAAGLLILIFAELA